MPRTLVLAGLLAVAVATAPVHAEPRTVSLAEVVGAVATAPAAPIAARETAAAEAGIAAAGAWPAPTVRVETNRLTARLVAGVAIPLPILGTVGAARTEASTHARVVRGEGVALQRDLRRRAVLAWIALARADADVEVRATAAQQAAELERIARGRLDAGAGAEVDVTMAVAARARADVAVSTARRVQEAAAATLAGVLGWDPALPLRAGGALPGASAAPLEVLRAHLREHPEHALGEARIAAAEATTRRVRAARLPGLAVEVQGSFDDPTQPGVDVLGALVVELPLFSRVGAQVRSATQTSSAARARAAATDSELAGELVAAYRRWQAAVETVAAFERDVLPAQDKATKLAEQAYREGARDLSTVLQAQRDLAGVRAELSAARGDLAATWVELQVAAGLDPGGAHAP